MNFKPAISKHNNSIVITIYKTIICIEKGTLNKTMEYFLVIKLVIKSLESQLYFINLKLRIVQIYLIQAEF